jgi:DNA-binding CsgD family transcriptional regulator
MHTASTRIGQTPLGGARGRANASAIDRMSIVPHELLPLFAAKDLEAFINASFHVLHAAVTCDCATAFYQSGESRLLKARDSRGRKYRPEFIRRYADLSPALPVARANRGLKIMTTRDVFPRTNKQVREMAFYRAAMQPLGWRHSVALCFWGEPPEDFPVFVVSAERSERRRDFSKHDVNSLERVHSFLDCAVNRIYEREMARTVRDGIAMVARDGAQGFAILDRNLRLVEANAAAHGLCEAWMDDGMSADPETSARAWRLPSSLADECRAMRQDWRSIVRADAAATSAHRQRRVVHPRVPGLTALITMVCPSTASLAEPMFVLELDRRVHGWALDPPDRSLPLLQRLTVSERRVALVLADGFSNQEIADQLGKSVHAVKFLLHKIYEKSGIPSRAALVAVLRSRPQSRNSASRKRRAPVRGRARGTSQ